MIDTRLHAITVEFDLVDVVRTRRRFAAKLGEAGRDEIGKRDAACGRLPACLVVGSWALVLCLAAAIVRSKRELSGRGSLGACWCPGTSRRRLCCLFGRIGF